jgi:hypothetical protein
MKDMRTHLKSEAYFNAYFEVDAELAEQLAFCASEQGLDRGDESDSHGIILASRAKTPSPLFLRAVA